MNMNELQKKFAGFWTEAGRENLIVTVDEFSLSVAIITVYNGGICLSMLKGIAMLFYPFKKVRIFHLHSGANEKEINGLVAEVKRYLNSYSVEI